MPTNRFELTDQPTATTNTSSAGNLGIADKSTKNAESAESGEELFNIIYLHKRTHDFHVASLLSADKDTALAEFKDSPLWRRADQENIATISNVQFNLLYPNGPEYFLVFYQDGVRHDHCKILSRTVEDAKKIFQKLFPKLTLLRLAKQTKTPADTSNCQSEKNAA